MSLNKMRMMILSISMLLIIVILGFTGAINLTTFKQSYNESLAANYKVLAEQTVRKIEYAIRYGKPLNNFYGIESMLSENLENVKGIEEVQVILPGGDIIYNQDGAVADLQLAEELKEKVRFFNVRSDQDALYYLDDAYYHVYSPIYDSEDRWIASLGLIFNQKMVTSEFNQYMYQLIYYFCGFLVLTLLLLLLFLYKVPITAKDGALFKNRIIFAILIILGSTQVTYGMINYFSLKNGYLNLVTENTSLALDVIQSDIEDVINKGVPYTELHGVGEYMNEMIRFLPEVERISLINSDFTTESVSEEIFTSRYSYSASLIADSTGQANYIHVVDLSKSYIENKMQGILLDTLTMIILSFLLIVEITIFVLLYLEKQVDKMILKLDSQTVEERLFIRPLSFIVFCAAFLTTSYIPILMNEVNQPSFGLPNGFLLGLPIGLEALFVLIGFLIAGPLNARIGWRTTFVIGIFMLMLGALGSALSWNSIIFLTARSAGGFGFGLVLLAMNRYSYRVASNQNNQDTFYQYQSGSISGMYLGVALGAVLAERIGLFNVFYVVIALLLLTIFFVLRYMPNYIEKRVIRRRLYFRTFELRKTFFEDKKILSLLLFVIIPTATASMFLLYLTPLYAHSNDVSVANIGRILLLQGLLMIYFSPLYTKHIQKYVGLRKSLLISAFLISTGLLLFAFWDSLLTAIIAVVLLGLGSCIGVSRQMEFLNHQTLTRELEEGTVTNYYHVLEYFGKISGLIIFVSLAVLLGFSVGVGIIGSFVILASLLFMIVTRNKYREKAN